MEKGNIQAFIGNYFCWLKNPSLYFHVYRVRPKSNKDYFIKEDLLNASVQMINILQNKLLLLQCIFVGEVSKLGRCPGRLAPGCP